MSLENDFFDIVHRYLPGRGSAHSLRVADASAEWLSRQLGSAFLGTYLPSLYCGAMAHDLFEDTDDPKVSEEMTALLDTYHGLIFIARNKFAEAVGIKPEWHERYELEKVFKLMNKKSYPAGTSYADYVHAVQQYVHPCGLKLGAIIKIHDVVDNMLDTPSTKQFFKYSAVIPSFEEPMRHNILRCAEFKCKA